MACIELCNVDVDGSHVNIKDSVCVIRSHRKMLTISGLCDESSQGIPSIVSITPADTINGNDIVENNYATY